MYAFALERADFSSHMAGDEGFVVTLKTEIYTDAKLVVSKAKKPNTKTMKKMHGGNGATGGVEAVGAAGGCGFDLLPRLGQGARRARVRRWRGRRMRWG